MSHNSPLGMSELPCGHYYGELGKRCNVAGLILILTENLYSAGASVPNHSRVPIFGGAPGCILRKIRPEESRVQRHDSGLSPR
jgi:hypothetical protein